MNRTHILPWLALAVLEGCAAGVPAEPPVKIQVVKAPIPVACAPDLGAGPAYVDTPGALAAAPDIYQRVKLLLEGRLQREQRLAVLNAAIKACIAIGPSSGAP